MAKAPRGRTTTNEWRALRKEHREQAIEQGLTNCPLCNTWMNFEHAQLPNSPELDHIIPYAEGGTDEASNLRLICRACNGKRGGKLGNARMRQRRANATPIDASPTFNW